MMNRILLLFTAFASSLCAQEFSLGALISGLVFDSGQRAVRPFLGIPGGGYLGEAVLSGLDQAWPAPDATAAVVVRDSRVFLVRGLRDPEPVWWPVEEAEPPILAAWNSASTGVAVYSRASGRLSLVAGHEAGPSIERWPDAAGEAPITSLVVTRDGRRVFFTRESEQSADLFVASAGSPARPVAALGGAAYPVLANEDRDLIIAYRSGGAVSLIKDAAGAAENVSLTVETGDSPEIIGAACSPDGKRLFLAGRNSRTVQVFNLNDGSQEAVLELDSSPSRVVRLSPGSLYLLNAPGNGEPLLVLNVGSHPGVYFVPANGPAAQEEN
jgi:hypothetical protein